MADRNALARATEQSSSPTPGYLYNDIAKQSASSPSISSEILSYLLRRLVKRNQASTLPYHKKNFDDIVKQASSSNSNMPESLGSLSLYPILPKEFALSSPTIVLTQILCAVCAPSPDQVNNMITSCNLDPGIGVYPFEPENLMEVIQSLEDVGNVCGVPERGIVFKREFEDKVQKLIQAVTVASNSNSSSNSNSIIDLQQQQQQKPKVLLLEWMSPPYDPGHWILYADLRKAAIEITVSGTCDGHKKRCEDANKN